ncbi:hypothetical protein I540_3808 [Mycobacteroides abscessus subsp. bolletii 1513]|uniref:Uncharacterized protein n=1 Tax=Mycobacteroides abscessus subsp. bolletii 1513 TaxID=1299321 RepID=X8DQ38_9MYCO|nr:hypothetical protein L830_1897 [Mycobacteroides abscessus MAB_082312_2258]EUA70519.1 hypothetical protein I540_3808 [Mycobacteroides abscessus subsp. bolletii 1513]
MWALEIDGRLIPCRCWDGVPDIGAQRWSISVLSPVDLDGARWADLAGSGCVIKQFAPGGG